MNIRLKVYLNNTASSSCFERIFDFNSDIKFPFEEVVRTQKVLFGIGCIVIFEIL